MKRILKSLYPLLPIAWMLFIFSRSMKDGVASGAESGEVLLWLQTLLAQLHIPLTLTDFLVRKGAHFAEYALLGALVYGEPLCRGVGRWRGSFFAWLVCVVVAVADEGIQALTPGRACRIADVLLDSLGAACGVLFLVGIAAVVRAVKAARKARRASAPVPGADDSP